MIEELISVKRIQLKCNKRKTVEYVRMERKKMCRYVAQELLEEKEGIGGGEKEE